MVGVFRKIWRISIRQRLHVMHLRSFLFKDTGFTHMLETSWNCIQIQLDAFGYSGWTFYQRSLKDLYCKIMLDRSARKWRAITFTMADPIAATTTSDVECRSDSRLYLFAYPTRLIAASGNCWPLSLSLVNVLWILCGSVQAPMNLL